MNEVLQVLAANYAVDLPTGLFVISTAIFLISSERSELVSKLAGIASIPFGIFAFVNIARALFC